MVIVGEFSVVESEDHQPSGRSLSVWSVNAEATGELGASALSVTRRRGEKVARLGEVTVLELELMLLRAWCITRRPGCGVRASRSGVESDSLSSSCSVEVEMPKSKVSFGVSVGRQFSSSE